MPIYEFKQSAIEPVQETSFAALGLYERRDLQRLLRDHINVIDPEILVIAEEFGEWDDSRRRVDLLGLDKSANLVVIELKRAEEGGHMDLQAIRYAAMISTMTFDRAVEIYADHLKQVGKDTGNPRKAVLDFLEWDEPVDSEFAQDVRVVLASAEFSRELTTSVLWLNDHDVDIRCVRLKPYRFEGRVLVDVQQVIPLPEASEYQVRVREKVREERQARTGGRDHERFDVTIQDQRYPSLPKRKAIFQLCRWLCGKGVVPEEISELFHWRPNRVWYAVDGTVDASDFARLAQEKALSGGGSFDRIRWFCDDDDLVQVCGKTYAFSNQWGGEGWHNAMALLKEKYVRFNITFAPTAALR